MLGKTPPKGMRDILPADLELRQQILNTVRGVYTSYGFTERQYEGLPYFEIIWVKGTLFLSIERYV